MTSAAWILGTAPAGPFMGNYETPGNWSTGTVPDETAFFGNGAAARSVYVTTTLSVGKWSITATPYTFNSSSGFTFNGAGIEGGAGSAFVNSGTLRFLNSSSAGDLGYSNTGAINFEGNSSASNAVIDNYGGMTFRGSSSAGNATITIRKTGQVVFSENASAENAAFTLQADTVQAGRLEFRSNITNDGKFAIGSLDGNGIVVLGSNEVSIGSRNTDTEFSGQISGTGKLVKVGSGELMLRGEHSFTGGTYVKSGELIVEGIIGSVKVGNLATASFASLSGGGTLGNTTIEYGHLKPADDFRDEGILRTGDLTIRHLGALSIQVAGFEPPQGPDSHDQVLVTGKVSLRGILGVQDDFDDWVGGGQTITIIDNDGVDAVDGTFSTLGSLLYRMQEGDSFASDSFVYRISYTGGDGNDVTLTTEGVTLSATTGDDMIETALGPAVGLYATGYSDFIYAEGGRDTVNAGTGNDTVFGGLGKDALDGGAGKDVVGFRDVSGAVQLILNGSNVVKVKVGGVNEDKIKNFEHVYGSTFNDTLTGDKKANWLVGDNGKDTLNGGRGNDTLAGSLGKDKLTGGDGRDAFLFNEEIRAADADTIVDFKRGTDKILLDRFTFASIGDTVTAGELYESRGAIRAHDGNDRLVYNTANGKLYYDADGNKAGGVAPILIATFQAMPDLDANSFLIV